MYLYEFLQEWGIHHDVLNYDQNPYERSEAQPIHVQRFEQIVDCLSPDMVVNGGNLNYLYGNYCCKFNAETRLAKRNVDLDRLSKSSPDLSSESSSSSTSSEREGVAEMGGEEDSNYCY